MPEGPSGSGPDDRETRGNGHGNGDGGRDDGRLGAPTRDDGLESADRRRDGAPSGDEAAGGDGGEAESDDGRVVPEPSSAPIRPGSPDLENVVFVVLGAVAMVLVIMRLAAIGFGG